jgi:methyltransferase (TIGR00027 family)
MAHKFMTYVRPVQGQILGRALFSEEKLEAAIASGIDQYVIIGAGLDSFAWRRKDLTASLQVFELDHPASQASKLKRISKMRLETLDNLHFVPIDFERQSLADTLSGSAFLREKPAFFSLLGVTFYLTEEAVMSTLSAISTFAEQGSQIVFDYGIHEELLEASEVALAEQIRRFTSRRGEELISTFDPEKFPDHVCDLGFKHLESLSPSEQNERYFAGRNDGLRTLPFSCYAHFEVSK